MISVSPWGELGEGAGGYIKNGFLTTGNYCHYHCDHAMVIDDKESRCGPFVSLDDKFDQ